MRNNSTPHVTWMPSGLWKSPVPGSWRQLIMEEAMNTRTKRKVTQRSERERYEGRQSWFSLSNKSTTTPPVLLWRPLSLFLSVSYHLSLLPFSQQDVWVCARFCVLAAEWLKQMKGKAIKEKLGCCTPTHTHTHTDIHVYKQIHLTDINVSPQAAEKAFYLKVI